MNGKIYYEIKINVYLINDIHCNDVYEKLSRLINLSFNNSQVLSCLHNRTGLKHYSFSALYPIELDRVYKADEIYTYLFRTYDSHIAKEYASSTINAKNEDFVVTDVVSKTWEHRDIQYVDNLTPTVFTLKDGMRWNKDTHGLDIAKKSIFKNLINKYNSLNVTKFEFRYEDIIKDIFDTWKDQDRPPKIHVSSPKSEKQIRAHADYVDINFLMEFINLAKTLNRDFDIMIEAKQKDKALHQLMEDFKKVEGVKILDGGSLEVL